MRSAERTHSIPQASAAPNRRPGSVVSDGPPLRKRRVGVFVGIFVIIAAGLGFVAFKLYPRKENASNPIEASRPVDTRQLLASLSNETFPETEKQVVKKIQGLIKEVEENPGSAFAWGKLGMNLQIHGFQSKAIPCYAKAIELNQNDFRWHYYKAMILHEMGNEEALTSYARAIEVKPGYAPAHYRYGKALFEKKQLEPANAELRKALDADPQMLASYVELARIALANNQLEESFNLVTQALKINPSYAEPHALLSELLRRSGRQEEAAKQTNIAQKLTRKIPVPDEAMQNLATEGVSSYWLELRARSHLEKGRYQEAVQDLQLAIQASPEARFFDTLGIAYQFLGQFEEAAEQHKEAVRLDPQSAMFLNNLSSAQFGLGNVEEAVKTANTGIEAEPDVPGPYLQLARIHVSNRQPAAAVDALERGHQRIPNDRTIGLQLAWLRATSAQDSLRNGQEAARLTQMYCPTQGPPDLECLLISAASSAELRNFKQATRFAEQAMQIAENRAPKETIDRIQQQLRRYRSSQPVRE